VTHWRLWAIPVADGRADRLDEELVRALADPHLQRSAAQLVAASSAE
jgi:hypothetical protein